MDGNFKAEHMRPRNSENEVWLMDGMGFMATMPEYKDYLAGTLNRVEVGDYTCHALQHCNAIYRHLTAATTEQ